MDKKEIEIMLKLLRKEIEKRLVKADNMLSELNNMLEDTVEFEELDDKLSNFWEESKLYYKLFNMLVERNRDLNE